MTLELCKYISIFGSRFSRVTLEMIQYKKPANYKHTIALDHCFRLFHLGAVSVRRCRLKAIQSTNPPAFTDRDSFQLLTLGIDLFPRRKLRGCR
ncbi:hypothetical protein FJTKL_00765 [Diaporthe vaccinii]|uniref:Uncharacterized protein n=1 Tax=Diaporthe vaccinii TaxID=105482 RepID=A0ABR4E2H4_9PEZI